MLPIKRYLTALFIGICFLFAGPIYSMDSPATGFTDGFDLTTQITLEPTISEVALVGDSGGESDPHWIMDRIARKSMSNHSAENVPGERPGGRTIQSISKILATVRPLDILGGTGKEYENPDEIPGAAYNESAPFSGELWRNLKPRPT